MIKPLLRTIPTLSGNVKLACFINECNLVKDKGTGTQYYETQIRGAKLMPASSTLFKTTDVAAGLIGSSWEYDLKKFYSIYSDSFFTSSFNYNKADMIKLDPTICQNERDRDFEFGVKRVNIGTHGKQFEFFAPIYIDSEDSIPDSFIINARIDCVRYVIDKKIRVCINRKSDSKYNYLIRYIQKYASQLDDNVAFCMNASKQACYWGIDLLNGGFVKKVDNVIVRNWMLHNTIHNFDATICQGFSRNNIAMKQILPLSFCFNINDILDDSEKRDFNFRNVTFSGWYESRDGKKIDIYDFDIDYDWLNADVLQMDSYGHMVYGEGNVKNIMDVGYPSLNECRYVNYRDANKVGASFCRWKLKHSSDDHPYIMNMSWAFSNNQKSNYRYGEFPSEFVQADSIVIPKNDSSFDYNLIFPLDFGQQMDYKGIYNSVLGDMPARLYEESMNQYAFNWFDIPNTRDVFDDPNIWSDVNDDGYVMHNGILYNFNNIYDEVPKAEKIDKFSVVLQPVSEFLTVSEFNKVKYADSVIDLYSGEKNNCNYNESLTDISIGTAYSSYMYFNEDLKNNDFYNSIYKSKGIFTASDLYSDSRMFADLYKIKRLLSYKNGSYISYVNIDEHIEQYNRYYRVDDLRYVAESSSSYVNTNDALSKIYQEDIFTSYYKLPIWYSDMVVGSNSYLIFDNTSFKYSYFDKFDQTEITINKALSEKLYYKVKHDKECLSAHLEENGKFTSNVSNELNTTYNGCGFYIKDLFVNAVVLKKRGIDDSFLEGKKTYKFYPMLHTDINLYDENVMSEDFDSSRMMTGSCIYEDIEDLNVIWCDEYNLKNLLAAGTVDMNDVGSLNSQFKKMYCKFLNKDHVYFYFFELFKNASKQMNDFLGVQHLNWNTIGGGSESTPVMTDDTDYMVLEEIIQDSRNFWDREWKTNIFIKKKVMCQNSDSLKVPEFKYEYHNIAYDAENGTFDSKEEGKTNKSTSFIEWFDNLVFDEKSKMFYMAGNSEDKFDLCFYKKMYRMDEQIYNMSMAAADREKFPDFYLYRIERPEDYEARVHEHTKIECRESFDKKEEKDIYGIGVDADNEDYIYVGLDYRDLDTALVPMFNRIYKENLEDTQIYTNIQLQNVTPVDNIRFDINTGQIMRSISKKNYRYDENDIPVMVELTTQQKEALRKIAAANPNMLSDVEVYSIYNKTKVCFAEYSNDCDDLKYYKKFNLCTKKINGENYGLYYIESHIDNTQNTFRMIGYNNDNTVVRNIKTFGYVNGKDVISSEDLKPIYKLMSPLMSLKPMSALQNISTINYPNIFRIPLMYSQSSMSKDFNEVSIHRTPSRNDTHISLQRYMHAMTPLITKKTLLENQYKIKFKDVNKYLLDTAMHISNGDSIYYKDNDFIDSPKPINVYSAIGDNEMSMPSFTFTPFEHKHYNCSKMMILPDEICYTFPKKMAYSKILDIQNEDNVAKLFRSLIDKNVQWMSENEEDKNAQTLFLLNKYNVEYDSIPSGITLDKSEKLYSLTIRFKLS